MIDYKEDGCTTVEDVKTPEFDFTYVINLLLITEFTVNAGIELRVIIAGLLDAYPDGFNREAVQKIYDELVKEKYHILLDKWKSICK